MPRAGPAPNRHRPASARLLPITSSGVFSAAPPRCTSAPLSCTSIRASDRSSSSSPCVTPGFSVIELTELTCFWMASAVSSSIPMILSSQSMLEVADGCDFVQINVSIARRMPRAGTNPKKLSCWKFPSSSTSVYTLYTMRLILSFSSALVASAEAWICELLSSSSSFLESVSTTDTSTVPVFSLASSTVKRSGNCVKPFPHSTPLSMACVTDSILVRSDRLAVLRRRLTPYTTCMPTISSSAAAITNPAVREMVFPTLEPEGSCSESGSTTTWRPRRRGCSPRFSAARDGSITPDSSSSENNSTTSSSVSFCFFAMGSYLCSYLISLARAPSNCIR